MFRSKHVRNYESRNPDMYSSVCMKKIIKANRGGLAF